MIFPRSIKDAAVLIVGDPRLPERFWSKVAPPAETGCWEWAAARGPDGYGRYRLNGRMQLAHRVCYQHLTGDQAEGLQMDHLCRNRSCVNPAHLEAVTRRENILRGEAPAAVWARRTHCNKGHEYTPDNTYTYPGIPRLCKACVSERGKARWRRKNR